MNHQPRNPFESIESAHNFVALLCETVADAHRDLAADIRRESRGKPSRRLEALRIACYNVEKLEAHLNASRRLLNDLRSLRRLLFDERGVARVAVPARVPRPAPAKTKVALVPMPGQSAARPAMAVPAVGGKARAAS